MPEVVRPKTPVPPIPISVFTPITLSNTSLNARSDSTSDCTESSAACCSCWELSPVLCSFLQLLRRRKERQSTERRGRRIFFINGLLVGNKHCEGESASGFKQ